MVTRRIPLIARVECWAGSRAEERPVAVTIGGRRIAIVDVVDRAFVTSAVAGDPVTESWIVELEDGSRVALERVRPDGGWRCWRIEE